MQRHTSTYLDLIRFVAAMVVFIGHTSGGRLGGGLGWQLAPFMDEAVTVFFVISGYVIGYVTCQREATSGIYATARAARIYSVAVPALAATAVLDLIGGSLDPGLYSSVRGGQEAMHGLEYLGALIFVNYFWYSSVIVGSNLAYWSLCYEVWYYVVFGVLVFAKGPWRWLAAALLLACVGPRIAGLFPVWLFGVAAFRIGESGRVGRRVGMLLFWGSIGLLVGHQFWIARYGPLPGLFGDALGMPDITNVYVVGLLVAAHLVGCNAVKTSFGGLLAVLERPIRWCAGATFTIYLFHMPLILFFASINPWAPTYWVSQLAVFGGTLVVMFVIAEFTERRKEAWRRGITGLPRLFAASRVTAR
jgi:peptidoglycan/LPS O-acetylase OafA/YrhL